MKVSVRYALPVVMGIVGAVLMVWDIQNQRINRSVGMGWDTGAPLWPYQTPNTLFFALNVPAYLVATPISRLFESVVPNHYFALYPAMLLWWWLAGLYFGMRRAKPLSRVTRTKATLLCLLALGLLSLGVEESRWAFHWWWTYSRTLLSTSDLILLRLLAPSVWFIALGSLALLSAWRRRPLRFRASVA